MCVCVCVCTIKITIMQQRHEKKNENNLHEKIHHHGAPQVLTFLPSQFAVRPHSKTAQCCLTLALPPS